MAGLARGIMGLEACQRLHVFSDGGLAGNSDSSGQGFGRELRVTGSQESGNAGLIHVIRVPIASGQKTGRAARHCAGRADIELKNTIAKPDAAIRAGSAVNRVQIGLLSG